MLDIKRHEELFNAKSFSTPVHVIGVGGMGSFMAESLLRMGLGIHCLNPIVLYDNDCFRSHNLPNQWASHRHLGIEKVKAVRNQMLEINPHAQVIDRPERVGWRQEFAGVVFICVDSMEARRQILDNSLDGVSLVECVIETRLDAGFGASHCFNPNDERQLACWRAYWHSDAEAENMQGCGGSHSIISAIHLTTGMALRQFEQFARQDSTVGMWNRVTLDFDTHYATRERWPSS